MKRLAAIYVLSVIFFAIGVGGILYLGKDLPVPPIQGVAVSGVSAATASHSVAGHESMWSSIAENFQEPIAPLLLQFIIILLAASAVGSLFARFGQPSVIGEITAGILLGPSLFGWLWPDAFELIFAKQTLGILQLFSQIGVCLFMFVVGLELDVGHLKHKAQAAVAVSHASIVVPFLLGAAVALYLFPSFGTPGTPFVTFALFMGMAMSVTAFPVLARILADRGMAQTPLGVTAIACAAAGDATAWGILAVVVAFARATGLTSTFISLGLVVLFAVVMVWGVRPLLPSWFKADEVAEASSRGVIASVLIFMTAVALATQLIGIHALFGAFLAGSIMPRSRQFREYLTVRLENFSSLFLLPLFFAFSGLRTQIGLLNDVDSWLICGGIIIVATAGKLGGSMLAARVSGMNWNESFSLGVLMNTRGLVELVALNIGYDLGILSPRVFSMLVLMALVTTFMTGPLLNLTELGRRRIAPSYAVLIPPRPR